MTYQLTIKSYEENPNYDTELAKYNSRQPYFQGGLGQMNPESYPLRDLERNVLTMVLTEQQFAAIKKAALQEFK